MRPLPTAAEPSGENGEGPPGSAAGGLLVGRGTCNIAVDQCCAAAGDAELSLARLRLCSSLGCAGPAGAGADVCEVGREILPGA